MKVPGFEKEKENAEWNVDTSWYAVSIVIICFHNESNITHNAIHPITDITGVSLKDCMQIKKTKQKRKHNIVLIIKTC